MWVGEEEDGDKNRGGRKGGVGGGRRGVWARERRFKFGAVRQWVFITVDFHCHFSVIFGETEEKLKKTLKKLDYVVAFVKSNSPSNATP